MNERTLRMETLVEQVVFKAGTTLGPYRILRQIGRGGMGTVYEAEHTMLHQHFAVKTLTLRGKTAEDRREGATRFLQEARVTAQMHHAGIVSVQTLETDATTGALYFVMEYVAMSPARREALMASALGNAAVWNTPAPSSGKGPLVPLSLEDLVQRANRCRGRIHPMLVRRILMDVCSALTYAHGFGEGIIHRDIKPANILIRPDGRAVVTDFGVAKILDDTFRREILRHQERSLSLRVEADGSAYHMVLGTEEYMAPELRAGAPPSPKTDLYALGVMAYQLLTGEIFSGSSAPPSAFGLPKLWDRVILGCLCADPERRWPDVAAFRHALEVLPRRTFARKVARWILWGLGGVAVVALGAGLLWGTPERGKNPNGGPPSDGMWVPRPQLGLYLRFEQVAGGVRLVRLHPDFCGRLVLPERFHGQRVVAVRNEAFYGCSHLTEVVAPEGVKLPPLPTRTSSVPPAPSALEAPSRVVKAQEAPVQPSDSVVRDAPADVAFVDGTKWLETREEDGNVTVLALRSEGAELPKRLAIPEEIGGKPVKALGNGAFKGASFEAIALPEGLERLGDSVFEGCLNLVSIHFPKSIRWERYGHRWLLKGCVALREVTFASQPPSFTKEMFSGCGALKRVTIPGDGRPEEVESPFWNVPYSARLVLTGSGEELAVSGPGAGRFVEEGGALIYRLMPGRKSYAVLANPWDSRIRQGITQVKIPATFRGLPVVQLDHLAFAGCVQMESLTLPDTITDIGLAPFRDCAALRHLELPASIRGGLPPTGVFRGCQRLKEIVFGSAPEVLTRGSFAWCNALERLVFRSGELPKIEPGAFTKSPNDIRIVAADGRETRASELAYAALNVGGIYLVETKGGWAVAGAAPEAGKSLSIPESYRGKPVVSVAERAFMGNKQVEEVYLPGTVRALEEDAFANSSLTRIVLTEGLERISERALCGTRLTSVRLPQSLVDLGESAFQNSELKEVPELPESLRRVAGRIVTGCRFTDNGVLQLPSGIRQVPTYFGWWTSGLSGIVLPGVEEVPPNSLVEIGCGFQGARFPIRFGQQRVRFRKGALRLHKSAQMTVLALHFPAGAEPVFDVGALSEAKFIELHVVGCEVRHWNGKTWVPGLAFSAASNDVQSMEMGGHETRVSALPHNYHAVNGIYLDECEGGWMVVGATPDGEKVISVPETYRGKPVVGVATRAFMRNKQVEEIRLPGTVRVLEADAFANSSLKHIVLPEGVERIGERAFFGARIASVHFPQSLRSIGESAFQNSFLEKVPKFPEGLKSIGKRVLTGCTFVDDGVLRLPSGMKHVPRGFGSSVTGLSGIELPGVEVVPTSGLAEIGNGRWNERFVLWFGQKQVRFNFGSLSLQADALGKILSLHFPRGAEPIFDEGAISGTPFVELHVEGREVRHWDGKTWVPGPASPPGTTARGNYPGFLTGTRGGRFGVMGLRNRQVVAIDVPSRIEGKLITTLGFRALANCWYAETLRLPETLEYVESAAFLRMGALRRVTLPGKIRWEHCQPRWLFQWCTKLEEVTLLSAPARFCQQMFEGCTSLRRINVAGDRLPEMGEDSFRGVPDGVRLVLLESGERFSLVGGRFVPVTRQNEIALAGSKVMLTTRLEMDDTRSVVSIRGLREGMELCLPAEIEGSPVTRVSTNAFAGCPKGIRLRLMRADVMFEPGAFPYVTPKEIVFPLNQPPIFSQYSFPTLPIFVENGKRVTLLKDDGDVRYLRSREGVFVYDVKNRHYFRPTFNVPVAFGARRVVGVLPYALQTLTKTRTVVVPRGVKYVWPEAFRGLSGLSMIEIDAEAEISEGTLWKATGRNISIRRRTSSKKDER